MRAIASGTQRTHRTAPSTSIAASSDSGKNPNDDDRTATRNPPSIGSTNVNGASSDAGTSGERAAGSSITIAGSCPSGPNEPPATFSPPRDREVAVLSTHGGSSPAVTGSPAVVGGGCVVDGAAVVVGAGSVVA